MIACHAKTEAEGLARLMHAAVPTTLVCLCHKLVDAVPHGFCHHLPCAMQTRAGCGAVLCLDLHVSMHILWMQRWWARLLCKLAAAAAASRSPAAAECHGNSSSCCISNDDAAAADASAFPLQAQAFWTVHYTAWLCGRSNKPLLYVVA